MDIITGLQTTQGKQKYNHLLGDSYSKRCEAFTLPNQEASETFTTTFIQRNNN